MTPFLQSVAKQIYSDHYSHLHEITVIFNNRRAGLFLQEEFKKNSDNPFFLPEIIGIDDLVSRLGNLQIVPHEFLLFELYDIHRNLENIDQRFDTFEEFMPFGEMLLSDFSEIDLYRINAHDLFENLHELKQLGEWDISGKPLTPFQQKYLNFFRSLLDYYKQFRNRLESKGQAYSGMAYRHVADNIEKLADNINRRHIYFVGFNALSDSEATIIQCCVRRGMATLICDGDDYYFSDTSQEAGHFLRKNTLRFPGIGNFDSLYSTTEKNIHIVNCPENTLQAKTMGKILCSLMSKKETTDLNCAIVLADEQMLLPVLNSLPSEINATNITMGFPFTLSNIHALNSKIISLHTHTRNGQFYHKEISAILSDNLIAKHLGTRDLHNIISKRLFERKTIYANRDEIEQLISDIADSMSIMFIFDSTDTSVDRLLSILAEISSLLVNSSNLKLTTAEKESLACSLQIIKYLQDIQRDYHCIDNINSLLRIYQRIAQRRSVAFYGEPLHGLQVLGMLETRSLDFNRIIMLSLNEGILPAGRNNNSLIPLSLKKAFGLPTYEEKDAVYAYNFYRLLQRTDKAWLIFNSFAESLGKGEPSRFILQLKEELSVRHPNIKITEHQVEATNTVPAPLPADLHIKDENAIHRLEKMADRGLSPSALNRYRNCPKQFFYSDILGVNEQDELNDELESNELGTFIHSILCDIYRQDPDGTVRKETLSKNRDDIDTLVDKRFGEEILKGRDAEGKNHIYSEVAKMQIKHFLDKEIALIDEGHSLQIVLTEEELRASIEINCDNRPKSVHLQGVTDRVDRFDCTLRIADYKSGDVNPKELKVTGDHPSPEDISDKWFQVMTYAWLYCRTKGYRGDLISGIFPLRSLGADFIPASWDSVSLLGNDHINRFEQLLKELLSEIFDPATPFIAKPGKISCANCPFTQSCPSALRESQF